jgi:tetrahydromethanopterin S-methyltransferase subunit G
MMNLSETVTPPILSTAKEGPKVALMPDVTITTMKGRRRIGTAVRILDGAIIAMILIMIIEAFGIRF